MGEDELSKIFILSQQDSLFPAGKSYNLRIFCPGSYLPYGQNVMASFSKGLDNNRITAFIGKKSHMLLKRYASLP